MGRYNEVDILKGIAVVCMVIFHIVYFPSQYGYKEFKYDTQTLLLIAKIAQVIFITCVGVNMYISYHNSKEKGESIEEYRKKQLKRILVLAVCALCMTLFSYYVFGADKFIKFGILHFISFSSLLLFMFVGQPKIIISLLVFVTALFTMKNMNPSLFSNVNPKIAFISGFYSKWSAIDHFPLVPWLILICFGILVGDVLESTGLGGIYPAGYALGEVTSFVLEETSAYAEVTVRPLSDLTGIQDILVILE